MSNTDTPRDLTRQPPRSPRKRLGGYALMARMIDKGRADLAGNVGEYHFACPLDQMLFDFKGVNADEVKKLLGSSATDEQVVTWFSSHGTTKTPEEIKIWSEGVEGYRPYDDPEKKDWFAGECAKIGLKPETSTLVDYLEGDDVASFKS
ncbi:MAG TPA: DUF5069 domain-containing protein [Chthoniobacterales bacterium]|jgi:hypothetical protein|nr:DUF5069 domain-containing protein [Chthoniobacterales bacterium]